jgi:hypothetical protein
VDLVKGDWTILVKLIIDSPKIPKNLDTIISKYIPSLFGTVCAGLKPRDNLPVQNNATDYNWTPILVVVAAIVVLSLVPMLCVLLSKSTQHKLTYYLVIISIVLFILVAVFVANPICLFKTCYVTSDAWIPMKGQYTGKGGASGLDITINATITFKDSDTIVFNKLGCTGSLCHDVSDLLVKCTSPAKIDTTKKTTLGYELTGDCVKSIKEQITGGSSVDGIFLAQVNGDLYVQVKIIFRELLTIYSYVLLAKV